MHDPIDKELLERLKDPKSAAEIIDGAMTTFEDMLEQEAEKREASSHVDADQVRGTKLEDMCDQLVGLKQQLDALDDERATLYKAYDDLRRQLIPDEMNRLKLVRSNKCTVRLPDGHRVSLRTESHPGVAAQFKDALVKFLDPVGFIPAEALTDSNVVKHVLRRMLANGQTLPPYVKIFSETVATVVKPKSTNK